MNPHKTVLIAVVELLKQQAQERAGTVEGLGAYQALQETVTQCEAWGVPLGDVGLAGFDLDELLAAPAANPAGR